MKKDNHAARIIGQRIRELRKQRLLTQEKLSDLSGVDAKHIQLMEGMNPSNPRLDTILNLCRAFGITVSEFFSESVEIDLGLRDKNEKTQSLPKSASLRFRSPRGTAQGKEKDQRIREVLLEDRWVYLLHEAKPERRGHAVIFFKNHYSSYFDSLPEEKKALWDMIEKAKVYLDREYAPSGYTVRFRMEGRQRKKSRGELFRVDVIPDYDQTSPEDS